MSEWQSIETAPKDEAVFLAAGIDSSRFNGCAMGTCQWGAGEWSWDFITEPTHWMPLPEPPNG